MKKPALLLALAVLLPAGTATASFTQEPGSPYDVGADPSDVVAGQFTADGEVDVAIFNGTGSTVTMLVRSSLGGFDPRPEVSTALAPGYGTTGDFDGDKHLDVALAAYTAAGGSAVLFGDGAGSLSNVGLATAWSTSATAADFNGDKRSDVAITQSDANNVKLFLSNGSRTLAAEPISAPTGEFPRRAVAADFDGALPDLAITNQTDGTVTILLRRSGGFVEAPGSPHAVGALPDGIGAGDFNRDGRADLAVVSHGEGHVTVLLGLGEGRFAKERDYPIAGKPLSVAVADFNRDGFSDFATANLATGTVSVMLRRGSGFVADGSPIRSDDGAASLTATDFNRDRKPDLAVINNSADDSVTILLNTTPDPPPPPPADLDKDDDGVQAPTDCDDANPAIRPGAKDKPGDGIDQDCSGADARLPVLKRTIAYKLGYGAAFTRFTLLKVKPARKGDRIRFACKGKGCKRKKAKVKVKKNGPAVSLTKYVKGAELKPGTRIELRITRKNSIGSFRRFTIRSGKLPKQTRRCLPPGAKKPAKC